MLWRDDHTRQHVREHQQAATRECRSGQQQSLIIAQREPHQMRHDESDKADIDEELTRLSTHNAEFLRLMKEEETAGRKLDFLCQEMHRAVNTMSNKLLQTEVAQHTIEMKQTIERIRQQVQNIE